jgi:hypothetical protein
VNTVSGLEIQVTAFSISAEIFVGRKIKILQHQHLLFSVW